MPDNIKISLQNGLVIVGVILSVGISYSANSGRLTANEALDLVQGVDIKSLQQGESRAALERQENRLMYKNIQESIARVENFVSTLEVNVRERNGL